MSTQTRSLSVGIVHGNGECMQCRWRISEQSNLHGTGEKNLLLFRAVTLKDRASERCVDAVWSQSEKLLFCDDRILFFWHNTSPMIPTAEISNT